MARVDEKLPWTGAHRPFACWGSRSPDELLAGRRTKDPWRERAAELTPHVGADGEVIRVLVRHRHCINGTSPRIWRGVLQKPGVDEIPDVDGMTDELCLATARTDDHGIRAWMSGRGQGLVFEACNFD